MKSELTVALSQSTLTSSLGDKVTNDHVGGTMCRKPWSPGIALWMHLMHSKLYSILLNSMAPWHTHNFCLKKSLSLLDNLKPEQHQVGSFLRHNLSESSVGLSVGGSHTVLWLDFFVLLKPTCKFNLVLPSYSTISSTRPCPGFRW